MENQVKQFRDDEVVVLRYWSKERQEYVINVYPKIGARLRLAHESNENIHISTNIYKYDENIAVVIGTVQTDKGQFTGIGMASVERDNRIAPAILELAESRSIARALRWAGYGVEYCSAEEVSHLENGTGKEQSNKQKNTPGFSQSGNGNEGQPVSRKGNVQIGFDAAEGVPNVYTPRYEVQDGQGAPASTAHSADNGNGGNGNGQKRRQLSIKQYNYIKSLGKKLGYDYGGLTELCMMHFNVEIEALDTSDASSMIAYLQNGAPIPAKTPAPVPEHQLNS